MEKLTLINKKIGLIKRKISLNQKKVRELEEKNLSLQTNFAFILAERKKRDNPQNIKSWKDLTELYQKVIGRKMTPAEKKGLFSGYDFNTMKKVLKCRIDLKNALGKADLRKWKDDKITRYLRLWNLEHELLNNGLCNIEMNHGNDSRLLDFFYNAWNGDYGNVELEDFGECKTCDEFAQVRKCYDCKELFCDKHLESDLCSLCSEGDCSDCGTAYPKDDLKECSDCSEFYCENCWNNSKEKCQGCSGWTTNECFNCEAEVGENESENKVSRCSECRECYCDNCRDTWKDFNVCPKCKEVE